MAIIVCPSHSCAFAHILASCGALEATTAKEKKTNTRGAHCHPIDYVHILPARLEPARFLWTGDRFARAFQKLPRSGRKGPLTSWTVLVFGHVGCLLLGSCNGVPTDTDIWLQHRKRHADCQCQLLALIFGLLDLTSFFLA